MVTPTTAGASRVAFDLHVHTCRRHYPGRTIGRCRSSSPTAAAFPGILSGRLLHCAFRGLLSVHSRYGLRARWVTQGDSFPSEYFSESRYLPSPLRLLPTGATSCRTGFAPAEDLCLCTAYKILDTTNSADARRSRGRLTGTKCLLHFNDSHPKNAKRQSHVSRCDCLT